MKKMVPVREKHSLTTNQYFRSPLSSLSNTKHSFVVARRSALTTNHAETRNEENVDANEKKKQELFTQYKECSCCRIQFGSLLEGLEHFKVIHKLHRCPACPANIYTLLGNEFTNHMKEMHHIKVGVVVDRIKCRFCEEKHRFEYMWQHISETHLNSSFNLFKSNTLVLSPPNSASTPINMSDNLKSKLALESRTLIFGKGNQNFDDQQRKVMVREFLKNPNQPWTERAKEVAADLNIEYTRVANWFKGERSNFKNNKFPKWAKLNGVPQYEVSYLNDGAMQIKRKVIRGKEEHCGRNVNYLTTPLIKNENKKRQSQRDPFVSKENYTLTSSPNGNKRYEQRPNAKEDPEWKEKLKKLEEDVVQQFRKSVKQILDPCPTSVDQKSDIRIDSKSVMPSSRRENIGGAQCESETKFSLQEANERQLMVYSKMANCQNSSRVDILQPISNLRPTVQQEHFEHRNQSILDHNSSSFRMRASINERRFCEDNSYPRSRGNKDNVHQKYSTSRICFPRRDSTRSCLQGSMRYYSQVENQKHYPQRNLYRPEFEDGYDNENPHVYYRHRPHNYERSWNSTKMENTHVQGMNSCNYTPNRIGHSIQNHSKSRDVSQFHFSSSDSQEIESRREQISKKNITWKERHAEITTVSQANLKILFKQARCYMDILQKYFKSSKSSRQLKVTEQTKLIRPLVENQCAFEGDQRECLDQCLYNEKYYTDKYVQNKNFKMDIARHWVPILVYAINFNAIITEAVKDFIEASKMKSPVKEFPDLETIKKMFHSVEYSK